MAQLPISGTSQSQTTTQSPQASVQAPAGSAKVNSVQPSTTSSLLTSGSSTLTLRPTVLPTVSLGVKPTTTVPAPAPSKHHVNSTLLGFSILLFIVAMILFWFTSRPGKSTV